VGRSICPAGSIEPTFVGYSIRKWIDEDGDGRYDVLEVETRHLKGPRPLDPAGMPYPRGQSVDLRHASPATSSRTPRTDSAELPPNRLNEFVKASVKSLIVERAGRIDGHQGGTCASAPGWSRGALLHAPNGLRMHLKKSREASQCQPNPN
jgi:hypothetical protein